MPRLVRRSFGLVVVLVATALLSSGCLFVQAARIGASSGGTAVPTWCQGSPDLSQADCQGLSLSFDIARAYAGNYRTLGQFTAAGGAELPAYPGGIGAAYGLADCCSTFNPSVPNVLLYDGTDPSSRLVGVAWAVDGDEPDGFAGDRDVWTDVGGRWFLPAWIIRG
ncbi:MAG: hypothetical protein R2695_17695, partial [Acidimicrobiales bacterium]